MLMGSQGPTEVEFHEDAMDASGPILTGPAGVSVSIVVVDARRAAVDGHVIVYLNLSLVPDFDFQNAPSFIRDCELSHIYCRVAMGCAWTHTKHVVDAAAEIAERDMLDFVSRGMLVLAALCHDVGKAKYTKFEDGRWRSRGHERGGVPIAEEFLDSIGCHKKYKDKILPMVGNHMAHNQAGTAKAIRRLAKRLEPASIEELARLCEADHSGRPPLPKGKSDNCLRMLRIASEKRVMNEGAKRILQGRHLIEAGLMEPSKELGVLLKKAYEAQMDGHFNDLDGAMEWTRKELA